MFKFFILLFKYVKNQQQSSNDNKIQVNLLIPFISTGLYLIGQYKINELVSFLLIMVSIIFRLSVVKIGGQYIWVSI